MADLSQAVQFVLHQEDARLSGVITKLPGDRGGLTRFGIAAASHPELVEQGYFEVIAGKPKIDHDDALAIAEKVYEDQYAAKVRIEEIADQDVANRVLSFAINEGPHEATALLQRALNACGCKLADDGAFGPKTLSAVNDADAAKLLAALCVCEEGFYRHLVAVRPELLPYLNGFLNRAEA